MRLSLTIATLVLATTSSGCFRHIDVHGCGGEAEWTEPGIAQWVEANGFAQGFGPPSNASLPDGVLPEGTMLTYAFRQARVGSSTLLLGVAGTSGNFQVERPAGSKAPSIDDLTAFWDQTMDAVYAGDEDSLQATWDVVRRDAWRLKEPDGAIFFRIQNAWTFDTLVGPNASFVRAEDGTSYDLKTGEWHLVATKPEWRRTWETVRQAHLSLLTVDPTNRTQIEFFYLDEEHEAKDLVRREIAAFNWTFDGFRFETGCPSPY